MCEQRWEEGWRGLRWAVGWVVRKGLYLMLQWWDSVGSPQIIEYAMVWLVFRERCRNSMNPMKVEEMREGM